MTETIVNWFIETFGGSLSKEIIVFVVSLMPILELRGGIIAGYALGLGLASTFIIAYIGNLLPIPFILMFIGYVFDILKKTPLKGFVDWCENKAISKSGTIKKYAYWGIFIFVAIPLPGTGAWTGALIAKMLKMDNKKAFLAIAAGVFVAGVIVASLSYGLLNAIGIG